MADKKPNERVEDEGALKIDVRSTPMIKKDEVPAEQITTSHRGVTIKPLSAETDTKPAEPVVLEPKEVAIEEPKVEEAPPAVISLPANPSPPVDDAPKHEAPAIVEPAVEEQPVGEVKEAEKPGEMQSPKVFDTKQYHLPINEGVAGGTGKRVMIFVIVILLIVIGGLVAIDAGWVDLGFKLPFDLIK
jgi:hypothetical protein